MIKKKKRPSLGKDVSDFLPPITVFQETPHWLEPKHVVGFHCEESSKAAAFEFHSAVLLEQILVFLLKLPCVHS
jgi:hypothetical protein